MTSKYQRVIEYADPYTSELYGTASGHAWDRLASIAGEYERGEITWERAKELCDDNVQDMLEIERKQAEIADAYNRASHELYDRDVQEDAGWY